MDTVGSKIMMSVVMLSLFVTIFSLGFLLQSDAEGAPPTAAISLGLEETSSTEWCPGSMFGVCATAGIAVLATIGIAVLHITRPQ
jgi:hypothetical protein